jgi:hypothetical protein
MKILIIPQQPSGTLSVFDLASHDYPREIKFKRGTVFAVVAKAHHNYGYTTHKTTDAVKKQVCDLNDCGVGHTVLDSEGYYYSANGIRVARERQLFSSAINT